MRALFFLLPLSLLACKKEAEVEAMPAPTINPATAVTVTVKGDAVSYTEMELVCKTGGVKATAPIVDGTVAIDGATDDCWIFLNPGRVSYGPVSRGAQLTCFTTPEGGLGCK